MRNLSKRLILAIFLLAAIPASADTVYLQGALQPGNTLSDATFAGSFEVTFPLLPQYYLLSNFDVLVTEQDGSTIEFDNNQTGTLGQIFGQYDSSGYLEIQFFTPLGAQGYQLLRLFFDLPFDGNAPVVNQFFSNGYYFYSGGIIDPDGTSSGYSDYTFTQSALASTSPIPEPSMLLPLSAAILWIAHASRKGRAMKPLLLALAAAFFVSPLGATTVTLSGTLAAGGSLSDATFSGTFDID